MGYYVGLSVVQFVFFVSSIFQSICFFGIFVYKRDGAGNETNVSGSYAVAVVSKSLTGFETKSAAWNCPQTALNPSDAIVVRVKRYNGTPIPESAPTVATFTTEQLNASQLDSVAWTVYYRLNKKFNQQYTGYVFEFWWGTTTYNSRIENFGYTPVTLEELCSFGDGMVFAN
jgi:hypothetical protein